ncbi:YfcZ/YiiS family protein [Glaesserella parasuis]|nr:YfcZ/YiiS family protein [Glaesserella parasuis]MDP0042931.1 YfcZ/YiiS family protein [Glaesserella parasuis]MDP0134429.1 YfcZ/YiiS family protein [Glaesserella parasuis]MDP0142912.1 YfcZ/YiiS family protein [Glaesserella parasuis]MDP0179140.1 YfcZ/YiiS family protein [Glaesserella parasuis]
MSECNSSSCCSIDVGTIIDNSDCAVNFTQLYTTKAEAEDALAFLTSKAQSTESERCEITSEIISTENGFQLTACFKFSYQVESMIFELGMR